MIAHSADGASESPGIKRAPRRDAQRNRDRILDAARSEFGARDDSVPLESIARAAGVGIGTLYRNFPTRESLVDAVYAAEVEDVAASAQTLLDDSPPEIALRRWLERYAEFVVTKRGMIDTLRAGWESGRMAAPTTRPRITAAIATILTSGVQSGVFRADVEPDDVTAMILGIFLATADDRDSEQRNRMFAFVLDSLARFPASSTAGERARS